MRLFIGVDLPAEIKEAVNEFQSELGQLGVRGRWKSKDNFHITLEFLGAIEASRINLLCETLSRVGKNVSPFRIRIGGIGAFPSFKQAHTLWTGLQGSLSELQRLRSDLHHELKTIGFQLEERKFSPHITLASRPNLENINFTMIQTKELGDFIVEEVVLFESLTVAGKRVYKALFSAGLEHGTA